ncbi:mRNA cap guanine-N7 methyltransferase-like [Homarus americanus]|uniref:mRNA cap guanine-N(7) methyltransferase n=1 Tax=Homarus americanus TaxID=6706 RepID=A0A8J5N4C0_HOMAM|nr:mRNA cap guanine-N7 methyltransferase-like [Homarus americanus]
MADSESRSGKRHCDGVGSIVANHYNSIEAKGLKERTKSRIFFMRNSNNWIKSYLINYCLEQIRDRQVDDYPISVLDLGCGKGGDLLKWQKGNIKHLICADIAETSMDQCQERHEINKRKGRGGLFSAEFIVADCTKRRIKPLFENPSKKVDLVSCQFAFHYCFESLDQAETMLCNVSENLKKGGYFVATIPNANEIMSRLKATTGNSFGNEVYRIEFPEDRPKKSSLFGDRYNFFLEGVVDCPEFLVHPPTLENYLHIGKSNMLPLCTTTLVSISQMLLLGQSKSKTHRNKYKQNPSNYPTDEQSTETDGEYSHAQEHLASKEGVSRIRTLSKSEWEALCLYRACVFKKIT